MTRKLNSFTPKNTARLAIFSVYIVVLEGEKLLVFVLSGSTIIVKSISSSIGANGHMDVEMKITFSFSLTSFSGLTHPGHRDKNVQSRVKNLPSNVWSINQEG